MQIERFAPCPLWVVGGHLSAFLSVRFPHKQTSVGVTITPAQCRSAASQTKKPRRVPPRLPRRSYNSCRSWHRGDSTVLGYFGRKPSQASSVHELLILAQITFDRLT